MKRILVLLAHPRIDRSEVNSVLARTAREIDGVSVVDLYAEYPTFEIDVEREQQRLLDHDVIVFQHPVYWYSCPALLKEWLDLVLEYGFAYGEDGRALEGKVLLNSVSAGARREVYSRDGGYANELKDFFAPFEQTAKLCRMRYLPPFALFASGHALDEDRLTGHVHAYAALLQALVSATLDLDRAEAATLLPSSVDTLTGGAGVV